MLMDTPNAGGRERPTRANMVSEDAASLGNSS